MKNRKRKNTDEISFVLVFSVQIVHCDFSLAFLVLAVRVADLEDLTI